MGLVETLPLLDMKASQSVWLKSEKVPVKESDPDLSVHKSTLELHLELSY